MASPRRYYRTPTNFEDSAAHAPATVLLLGVHADDLGRVGIAVADLNQQSLFVEPGRIRHEIAPFDDQSVVARALDPRPQIGRQLLQLSQPLVLGPWHMREKQQNVGQSPDCSNDEQKDVEGHHEPEFVALMTKGQGASCALRPRA